MKKRKYLSTVVAVVVLLALAGVAAAFGMGNVDGVWQYVEDKVYVPESVVDVIGVLNSPTSAPITNDHRSVRADSVCAGSTAHTTWPTSEWTQTTGTPSWGNFGSFSSTCPTATTLFFSEYARDAIGIGGSDRIAFEIYNGTGSAVDLSGYSVRLYTGTDTYTTVALSGTLANGDVYVVANNAAAGSITGEDLTFGSNDSHRTVVLVKNATAEGAYCITYGTGPGTAETARSRNDPSIQGPLGGTDENQIHYGKGISQSGNCPMAGDPGDTWFDAQSGLGFDGNNNVGANLVADTPFWLGRLTHYNRTIYLTDDGTTPPQANFMEWVDLDVQVENIMCSGCPTCNPAIAPYPATPGTMTFTYRVYFDETPNNASPCPYGGNTNGCYDAVTVGSAPPAASFSCPNDGNLSGNYTITLLGFTDNGTNDSCPTTYPGGATNQFITREQSTNHGCLYAQISEFEPTAVELKSFTATAEKKSVVLSWETASETDNLGFNLYRAESAGGERIQLNAEIIPSNVYPGSQLGAAYSYTDSAVYLGRTYTYWLEDVDVYGKAEMHGPVEVNLGGTASPKVKGLTSGKPAGANTADGGQTW